MRKHSKHQKGQAQKDTKHMTPLNKNHMQRKQTSLEGSRKEMENTKVRFLSSDFIMVY
jgi:hypothetical protein